MDFFGVIFTVIFCSLSVILGMYFIAQYPVQILVGMGIAILLAWVFWPRQDDTINPPNEWE